MARPINCTNTYDQLLKEMIEFNDVSVDDLSDTFNLNTCDKFNYNVSNEKKFTYNDVDVCRRVVKSADRSFYKHTYDPTSWVVPLLQENTGLNEEQIRSILNLERKENCCNCITIVLYSTGDIQKLYSYLYSMKKSLDTVSNELDDFIVRFYLDRSVFKVFKQKKFGRNAFYREESFNILKYMIHHPRSEIVMYFCRDIDDTKKGTIRRFRFLPMIEDDVNILISREADGFVSYEDCHNIRLFARDTEHRIGMIYDFIDSNDQNNFRFKDISNPDRPRDTLTNAYQIWLEIYGNGKLLIDYLDTLRKQGSNIPKNINSIVKVLTNNIPDKDHLIEVLAGAFGVKVKFQKNYFVDTTRTIRERIKRIDHFNSVSGYDVFNPEYTEELRGKLTPDRMDKFMNIGFDEILLQELFFPFTSYPYPKESSEIREESVKKIKNVFVLVDRTGDRTLYKNDNSTGTTHISSNSEIDSVLDRDSLRKYNNFIYTLSKPVRTYHLDTPISWKDYMYDLCFSRQYILKDPHKYYGYAMALINQPFFDKFKDNHLSRYNEVHKIKKDELYSKKHQETTVLQPLFDMMYPEKMIKQGGYIMQRKRTTRRKRTHRKRTHRRK